MSFHPLDPEPLLPPSWCDLADRGPTRVFNPAIAPDRQGWIVAYRFVAPDGRRRIGAARLDADFRAVPGSGVAVSDLISFPVEAALPVQAREWFADPRFYRIRGRLHLYWNSGWHEQNGQFLVPLDAELRPDGLARELSFPGGRRSMEKNWMIFGEGPWHAVYLPCPQRVLSLELDGTGPIRCSDLATTPWDSGEFAARYGELRGGAPPQRVGDSYFGVCHSVAGTAGDYAYVPSVYEFSAFPPFAPRSGPVRPLALPNPEPDFRRYEKLNPAVGRVVYPCGAVRRGDDWVISYGLNDERMAIAVVPHAEVLDSVRPISPSPAGAT